MLRIILNPPSTERPSAKVKNALVLPADRHGGHGRPMIDRLDGPPLSFEQARSINSFVQCFCTEQTCTGRINPGISPALSDSCALGGENRDRTAAHRITPISLRHCRRRSICSFISRRSGLSSIARGTLRREGGSGRAPGTPRRPLRIEAWPHNFRLRRFLGRHRRQCSKVLSAE